MTTRTLVVILSAFFLLFGQRPKIEPDRYPKFSAYFSGFDIECVTGVTRAAVLDHGEDITSVLYAKRSELIELMSKGGAPSILDERNVRLIIKFDEDEWVMDSKGTISKNGKQSYLSNADYRELRRFLNVCLPSNRFFSDADLQKRPSNGPRRSLTATKGKC